MGISAGKEGEGRWGRDAGAVKFKGKPRLHRWPDQKARESP